jgi:hypothetical protein
MPYDLVKEVTWAIVGIGILVFLLAAVFSTPDVPMLSVKQVAVQDPMVLVNTELGELSNTSEIAQYGPPYNHNNGSLQSIGGFAPQTWLGVTLPVNPAQDDVIQPLQRMAAVNPTVGPPLSQWQTASGKTQQAWIQAVQQQLPKATIHNGQLVLPHPGANLGPVPAMVNDYLALANSGLLEPAIDAHNGPMPETNRTLSLLLLQGNADHIYANKLDMTGLQWGITKETGNYPGAVWLWFYTLLYQIPPYSTASNGDLLVVLTVLLVTAIWIFLPFIPGLRSIPRGLRVYRYIWRDYYREQEGRR